MGKRAIAIVEAKEGYDWAWGRDERVYYQIKVKKLKGNYAFEEVKKVCRNGAGFEGVGGAEYTVYKVKIYKDFVGSVVQEVRYTYSGGGYEEVLFDNSSEAKENKLKEYLKAIETAKRLDPRVRCNLVIYFDSDLFTLREFFEFVRKLKELHTVYPIRVEKEFESIGLDYDAWLYRVYCEGWYFTLRYSKVYHGKDANKKVDKILLEYRDWLRDKDRAKLES
jgi:hypothetical protein